MILNNNQKQKAHLLVGLIENYKIAMGCEFGNLHIVLADDNFNDSCVALCCRSCLDENDYIGEVISKLLLEFTEEEREIILTDICDYELNYDEYQKTLKNFKEKK